MENVDFDVNRPEIKSSFSSHVTLDCIASVFPVIKWDWWESLPPWLLFWGAHNTAPQWAVGVRSKGNTLLLWLSNLECEALWLKAETDTHTQVIWNGDSGGIRNLGLFPPSKPCSSIVQDPEKLKDTVDQCRLLVNHYVSSYLLLLCSFLTLTLSLPVTFLPVSSGTASILHSDPWWDLVNW